MRECQPFRQQKLQVRLLGCQIGADTCTRAEVEHNEPLQESLRVERSGALSVKVGKNLGGPDARGLLERRFTRLPLALPPRLCLGVQLLCNAQCDAESSRARTHSKRERNGEATTKRRAEGRGEKRACGAHVSVWQSAASASLGPRAAAAPRRSSAGDPCEDVFTCGCGFW